VVRLRSGGNRNGLLCCRLESKAAELLLLTGLRLSGDESSVDGLLLMLRSTTSGEDESIKVVKDDGGN
jgi:hypothetical protein